MENPIKMDDFGVPIFLETPSWWTCSLWFLFFILVPMVFLARNEHVPESIGYINLLILDWTTVWSYVTWYRWITWSYDHLLAVFFFFKSILKKMESQNIFLKFWKPSTVLGGGFNFFNVTPNLGERWSNLTCAYFSNGLVRFNHQPDHH